MRSTCYYFGLIAGGSVGLCPVGLSGVYYSHCAWGREMKEFSYTHQHPRARKARTALLFDNKLLRLLLQTIIVGGFFGWVWLVFFERSMISHLLLGVSGGAATLLFWYYGELKTLRSSISVDQAQDIAEVLERHILGRMRQNSTPQDIAVIISKQSGGYFFASRYGVGPDFLQQSSSTDPITAKAIWQRSRELAVQTGDTQINSAAVAAALTLAIPGHDMYLAHLQIDGDDIIKGVSWFDHIQKVINYHQQKRNFGGIGRDLSFGWAPLLNNVGFNITESIQRGGVLQRVIGGHQDSINQLVHLMGQPGRRNAVLVGPVGVGKTTIAYAFAQNLVENRTSIPPELQYHQVITLDASNLIANAKGRGQLEELLIHIFNEAIAAKNVILFLDEAQLFLKDGTGSVDLSNILLPVVEGGALRLILSLNDQEWLRLSQTNPGFTQMLNRVAVKPLEQADVFRVMEDQTLFLEARNNVVYMHQALKEAYRLADRFIHEQAFPGKAIKLLESAAGFAEQQHFITAQSVQQAVEKSFDVKVQTADTIEEKNTLLNLEQRIHERMINQSRAVKLVSDALRRARAGERNENKPIGTFLFLGPTGVGKTELSKSLAAVYFGGEDHLVRIDLNEYSSPGDTARLLAVGAQDPYSLCAQISKQPFSVVLLDEIEKAHPNVLNLLLQMLDEGVLRDSENKPISFKDAIIIATSNAGAEKIRAHIEHGEQLEQFEQGFIDELINANIFRPEFLNRFDEIVLFRPLNKQELAQVVDLLLTSLNKTLAQRKVSVSLTPAAKDLLVQTGYDPRLGARPLRRTVQRTVENVVSQHLLSGQIMPGQTLQLDVSELQGALTERQ